MKQYRNICVNYYNSSNSDRMTGLLSIDDNNIELIVYNIDSTSKVNAYSSNEKKKIVTNLDDIKLNPDHSNFYKNGILVKTYQFVDSDDKNLIHYIYSGNNDLDGIFGIIDIYNVL